MSNQIIDSEKDIFVFQIWNMVSYTHYLLNKNVQILKTTTFRN